MINRNDLINYKSPNVKKLLDYGFKKTGDKYQYSKNVLNQFCVYVIVDSKNLFLKVIDLDLQEEYNLAYLLDAVGQYVGAVKQSCEEILQDVVKNCFDVSLYKCKATLKLIEYVRAKYGVKEEYLWEKFPSYAVFRNKTNKKWFCVVMTIDKSKLGFKESGLVEVVNLTDVPEIIEKIVDNKRYFKGYHMNKKYWYTLLLDDAIDFSELCIRLDNSYNKIAD